jgi:hypothetical protein
MTKTEKGELNELALFAGAGGGILGGGCLDGEQFAQSSGSNTQQAYCAPDKMTGFSRVSRFGMTFKPLTESRGEELLMSYLADFHAKTLVQQEKVQALTESDQECGGKWLASFTKFDPDSSLWRTHQCSLLGGLDEFSGTWPAWGLMRDGECWEQMPLAHPTKESAFGFTVPTPVASDGTTGSLIGKNDSFYETRTGMPRKVNQNGKDGSVGLGRLVKMWPSPKARDWKDGRTEGTSNRQSPDLGKVVGQSKTTGSLNPTWVEWLMGWPLGWTDLKPLETDKSHFALQQHGESLVGESND